MNMHTRPAPAMKQRAFAILETKAFDEEERTITGMATTPSPDRMGDIIEPLGATFTNPLPLLHQHRSDQPVGTVKFGKPTKAGIPFVAKLPKIKDPGPLKDRVDTAWGEVVNGLVRAVSIGFRAVEYAWMEDGGIHFLQVEIMELSLVTIPANADATIETIKSYDDVALAASGRRAVPVVKMLTPPGDSGQRNVLPAPKERRHEMKTVKEQIAGFEATRAAKAARMEALMSEVGEKGLTLDAAQSEEYDGLEAELKAIDAHLVRLQNLERTQVTRATEVQPLARSAGVIDPAAAAGAGRAVQIQVKGNTLPKGTAFTRYAIALARSHGNLMQAAEIAKGWDDSTPEVGLVLKAAIAAGTTTDATWAAPLVPYQQMAAEFIELLRPQTIIGRIPGLRRVPFNISMPRQTSGSTVGWVGEAKAKPVGKLAFDTVTMRWAKAAGIVVLTEELIRFSNPSAEEVVRNDLIETIARFLDVQFLDPAVAISANISPASITNGVTPIPASGTTADHLRVDANAAINALLAGTLGLSSAVWIMDEVTAATIGGMMNAFGQPEFPGLNAFGGTFMGLPVITSEGVPANLISAESPPAYAAGRMIVLVKANEIFLADEGGVTLDVSREASLQMDSEPDEPTAAGTVMVSLWQRNMVGLRAERWINWLKRRSTAVQWIAGAAYVVATPS